MTNKKLFLEADIRIQEETDDLKKAVASVIKLPDESSKQPDLLYFTAIFVSSGANLNHAYFQSSELTKAEGTIVNKALDIEHKEEEIVGHIYDRAFINKNGEPLNITELASMDAASLDGQEIHVVIAGIVYKTRFPELAAEIKDNKWKVSMETYYDYYDVKVGNLVLSRQEAESLGLTSGDKSMIGKAVKLIKNSIEIASGTVDRVLRNLTFSGCGFVKKPANPPSIVLETASDIEDEILVISYDDKEVSTDKVVLTTTPQESITVDVENSELQNKDTVGICVSYKKEVIDSQVKDQRSNVLHTDWCTLYERSCTSFSRDTTDPKCLRSSVRQTTKACIDDFLKERSKYDKRLTLLNNLSTILNKI